MAKPHRKGAAKVASSREPERRCIVGRQVKPKDQLIRFVLDPEARVVADLKHKLPGRGVWVTATRKDVETAIQNSLFSRAFKQSVIANQDLGAEIDRLLVESAGRSLSLAKKAGLAVPGFDNAMAAAKDPSTCALIHASDGAEDGIRKIRQELERHGRSDAIKLFRILTSDEISLALGRLNVVHAVLKSGGAARNCIANMELLIRYRSDMASTI